ncbi:ICE-like protease (caspase) p20 domain protein [Rhizoctonia solani 123E]|uniref:ICE-like protease (Caspase) p20 domain protein n=1 Tax=Rhizoctonia solani 123E TaxID=1423351 RepID=A0A074SM67_9AGAM|nr:ICE-like protease (caspase) p20 domain protein [Rhizoctonia solani 123E]
MISTKTQALFLRPSAIVIKTISVACMRVSGGCIERGPHGPPVPPGPQSHWNSFLTVFVVALIVLLVLSVSALITRHPSTVGDEVSGASRGEANSLLRTTPPNARPEQDYQACRSRCTTNEQPPIRSPRGSNKPILQPLKSPNFILEDSSYVVMSPVEGLHDPPEPLAAMVAQLSSTRGRAVAVTQNTDPINSGGLGRNVIKPQMHGSAAQQCSGTFRNPSRTRHISPVLGQANQSQVHAVPSVKARSATLVKSLTGLVLAQQATIHVLGVGMSWNGFGGDTRQTLPGPPHDMEWLQNFFTSQENFRFKSLLDRDATLEAVHQSLGDMHSVAGDNDFIVLYLSGHGAHNDSFELYSPQSPDDSDLLNEAMLNEWIIKFRSKTGKPPRPVYIIFDFCRPSLVEPKTKLDGDVNVIWACSPTQSALDLKLKSSDYGLPRSCFLLSLLLAIDDFSADPTAPMVERFTIRMKEFVRVIRGLHCYGHKCRRPAPWRCCRCKDCLGGKLCTHDKHQGDLPFQVVSIGGIGGNSDLSAVAKYIADRFPLHIKRVADRVSKHHWVLYFNPSHISANRRPLNPRNHRLGMSVGIEANMTRNMTIPVNLIGF